MKFALILALLTAPLMAATPAIVSPTPGSVFAGSEVYFQWSSGGIPVQLHLNTAAGDPAATRFFSTGTFTAGALDVAHIPTNGAPLYVTLLYEINGVWSSTMAQYIEAGGAPPPPSSTLTGFTCTALSGSTSTCTVTISAAAPTGGFVVTLSSPSPTVTVPPSVTVAAGAKSATFPATVNPVVLTAKAGTVTDTASLSLAGGTAPPPASPGAYLVTLVLAQPNPPLATYQIWDSANGGAYGLLSGTGPLASGNYSFYAIGFDASGNASPHSNTQSLVIP